MSTKPRGNAKHQAAAAKTADLVAQLRNEIRAQLVVVVELDRQLQDLAGTRQSVGLGFMTPEGRAAAGKQATIDRGIARGAGRIDTVGHGWLNATSLTSPAGVTQAAATIPAVSVSAEILFTLQHQVRRLGKPALEAALREDAGKIAHLVDLALEEQLRGWCDYPPNRPQLHPLSIDPPTSDGDVVHLARDLARLVEYFTNRTGLQALLRELDQLEQKARDVVDGPAKTNHPDVCPWCGRGSLVIHHREQGRDSSQVIRCEGEHRCECTWEWCDCHRNPRKNRHEWVNSGRASHTWTELHNLQTKRKELLLIETRATDAIERIRQLHQPTWRGDNGQTAPAYIYIVGDCMPIPADHECVDAWTSPAGDVRVEGCYDAGDGVVLHAIPVCTTCGTAGDTGDLDQAVLWPCPTYRATDLDSPDNTTEE